MEGVGEPVQYTFYNSQEGYDDLPENYSTVTYTIEKKNEHQYKFTYLRENITIEFERMNQESFLPMMLEQIKNLAGQG
jgi:hypothetical protein